MKKLGINTTAAIFDIINAILFTTSWFVITFMAFSESFAGGDGSQTSGVGTFFYVMAAVGLIIHIIGLVKSRKVGISIIGHILGIIGCACFVITSLLAFPAIVLLIIASVFCFRQKPVQA
ncbi:hypothetical protein LAX75_10215 [Listeria cossartiae]|uniref:hypothetical protein n=1 Tax=Listeria cossartiae TaxID=2838249 RepID=UPI001627D996|nr:hypothetical protein [Listeria cossartiae]MBC1546687.1 hypothetical protein [Listeria cossartiae subsp. cossartiae]MBC1550258.1 hypothetical protein [Listeria cossartiae subsp. cossartiae]MBC1987539.1 hypothetical protein [Listeria cossartiae subsp. cossartiae]MCD2224836.1 hypothetical protein [Listeria cossartiae]MCD2239755.1 hypothetical protein [Listeria cossartiae]